MDWLTQMFSAKATALHALEGVSCGVGLALLGWVIMNGGVDRLRARLIEVNNGRRNESRQKILTALRITQQQGCPDRAVDALVEGFDEWREVTNQTNRWNRALTFSKRLFWFWWLNSLMVSAIGQAFAPLGTTEAVLSLSWVVLTAGSLLAVAPIVFVLSNKGMSPSEPRETSNDGEAPHVAAAPPCKPLSSVPQAPHLIAPTPLPSANEGKRENEEEVA